MMTSRRLYPTAPPKLHSNAIPDSTRKHNASSLTTLDTRPWPVFNKIQVSKQTRSLLPPAPLHILHLSCAHCRHLALLAVYAEDVLHHHVHAASH